MPCYGAGPTGDAQRLLRRGSRYRNALSVLPITRLCSACGRQHTSCEAPAECPACGREVEERWHPVTEEG